MSRDFYVNVKGIGIYMQLKYLTRHAFSWFFWVSVFRVIRMVKVKGLSY